MDLPVLTAVTGAAWESRLVTALNTGDHGVTVVRRCVDLADLLAAAAAGAARAVLLSPDLRRLDRDAVLRLTGARVAIVGLVDPSAPAGQVAEERLRLLGIEHVVPADADPAVISAAIARAVADVAPYPQPSAPAPPLGAASPSTGPAVSSADAEPDARSFGDPARAVPRGAEPITEPAPPRRSAGQVIAVWGPTGAPGRTTVAVGIADEAARLGVPTLLVDADVYGGVIAQLLGLLDESAGLAAACRRASAGSLDVNSLARLAWAVGPALRVLTGISRADRWPELRPATFEMILDVGKRLAPLVVVDCGFSIEQDEELAYDTAAPRRNGATLAILEAADEVVCVSGADPVALQRTVRGLTELREILPDVRPRVVVNRLRGRAVPGDARREVGTTLHRLAGVEPTWFLPDDRAAVDDMLAGGRTLADVAPGSPLRHGLRELAGALTGAELPARGRRRR